MKGELTYNIEVINARLIEVNKLVVVKLKEEQDGNSEGKENVSSNGGSDSPGSPRVI